MHVRCPHCHNPIELVAEASLEEIVCTSCGSSFNLVGTETTESYRPGTQMLGHFEVIQQLGIGHFGSVWKARDTELDRVVAIKMPRQERLNRDDSELFFREARAAAQLNHPNIVSVHEVGREGEQIYIVSSYVDGADLSKRLSAKRLPAKEAAELCAKIADGLQHAHEAGVFHRDLKPANIMMDTAGEPHIMDFGLARRESGEITMTVDGNVLGTPAYMSPEQAKGKSHEADARSDVYSLGVIFYELLTGERPFRGERQMLLVQIANEDPPAPRKLDNKIPRNLETICLKCLRKEPGRRYQTAAEVSDDLRRAINNEPIKAKPVGRFEKTWLWCKRRPASAGLIASVVVLVLVAIIVPQFILAQRRVNERKRAATLVDTLIAAPPEAVPYAIQNLEPLREHVLPILQRRFDDLGGQPTQQLHVAYALAAFGEFDFAFPFSGLMHASPLEYSNVVRVLEDMPDAWLSALDQEIRAAHARRDWPFKAELAIVGLHVGNRAPTEDMLEFENRPDPIQRTVFIRRLSNWPGDVKHVRRNVSDAEHPGLRSGVCLAAGNILRHVEAAGRSEWTSLLTDWYSRQRDGGTHSAAGWALRQCAVEPQIDDKEVGGSERGWTVTEQTGLTMIRLHAGQFQRDLGLWDWTLIDSEPQTVQISRDFLLTDREITIELFRRFIEDEAYEGEKPKWQADRKFAESWPDQPADEVSWYDAILFCNWLSWKEDRTACYKISPVAASGGTPRRSRASNKYEVELIARTNGFRLPTEAEWEYACRAGTTTRFSCGDKERELEGYATFSRNSESHSAPVGYRMCNAWGLYDMHGNVEEWCWDRYADYEPDAVARDPSGPTEGSLRVCRGGGYWAEGGACESVSRGRSLPEFRSRGRGFRVAADLPGLLGERGSGEADAAKPDGRRSDE